MRDASGNETPVALKGIVFDLDGTLVDSYRAIWLSLNYAREGFGLPPLAQEEVRSQVGRGLEQLIADLVGPQRVEAGVARFRLRYAEVYAEHTHSLPGVSGVLARLHSRGLRMAVASNKPAKFGGPILQSLGLLQYFDHVDGPDLAGSTKPEPTMIRRCLAAIEQPAEAALYVGDMPLDVESGRRAGLAVLLVATGSSPAETLLQTGCPVIERFEQLPGWLDDRPAV